MDFQDSTRNPISSKDLVLSKMVSKPSGPLPDPSQIDKSLTEHGMTVPEDNTFVTPLYEVCFMVKYAIKTASRPELLSKAKSKKITCFEQLIKARFRHAIRTYHNPSPELLEPFLTSLYLKSKFERDWLQMCLVLSQDEFFMSRVYHLVPQFQARSDFTGTKHFAFKLNRFFKHQRTRVSNMVKLIEAFEDYHQKHGYDISRVTLYEHFSEILSLSAVEELKGCAITDYLLALTRFKLTKSNPIKYSESLHLPILANDLSVQTQVTLNSRKLKDFQSLAEQRTKGTIELELERLSDLSQQNRVDISLLTTRLKLVFTRWINMLLEFDNDRRRDKPTSKLLSDVSNGVRLHEMPNDKYIRSSNEWDQLASILRVFIREMKYVVSATILVPLVQYANRLEHRNSYVSDSSTEIDDDD